MPPSGQSALEKVVRRVTADGRVGITESELGNLDVVAFLSDLLDQLEPVGQPADTGTTTEGSR